MVLGFGLLFVGWSVGAAVEPERVALATTFPVYQITRNVVQGREGMVVALMIPAQMGCPHDYALTPQDMRKLAQADFLVVNGLGLEVFLGASVEKANPRMRIINGSAGIPDLLRYVEEEEESHDHDEEHLHEGVNPHLFASPRLVARMAVNIAEGLAEVDPEGGEGYRRNAAVYAERMNRLADEMAALGSRLENNRIIEPHGVFDYLARDMGLEVVGMLREHGREPSASEMITLVKTIRERKAGAIFTEPQYPGKVAEMLARESGVPVRQLDPVATGPEQAPLDYYEAVMRRNMTVLEAALGVE